MVQGLLFSAVLMFGIPSLPVWLIKKNVKLAITFGEDLHEKMEKKIKENYLYKNKRIEFIKIVQDLYKAVILPEYINNKGNEDCKFFAKCAEKQ